MELIKEFENEIGVECINKGIVDKKVFWSNYKEKLLREDIFFQSFVRNALKGKFLEVGNVIGKFHSTFNFLDAQFFDGKKASQYFYTIFPIEGNVNRVGATAIITAYLEILLSEKNSIIKDYISTIKDPKVMVMRLFAPPLANKLFFCEETINFISPFMLTSDGIIPYEIEERHIYKMIKVIKNKKFVEISYPHKALFDSMFSAFLYYYIEENSYSTKKNAEEMKDEIIKISSMLNLHQGIKNSIIAFLYSKNPHLTDKETLEKMRKISHYIVKGEMLKTI